MKRIHMDLLLTAAEKRGPGYVEEVIRSGRQDGPWIELENDKLDEIRARHGGFPPLRDQVISFVEAYGKWARAGFPCLTDKQTAARLKVCRGEMPLVSPCEFWDKESGRCRACGCYGEIKARWATTDCPKHKWPKL